MIDTEICTTSHKLCSHELSAIVFEYPLGFAESVDYALQKFDQCIMCDVHYCHDFYPLGERVDSDE
jgi:hypothetical protein